MTEGLFGEKPWHWGETRENSPEASLDAQLQDLQVLLCFVLACGCVSTNGYESGRYCPSVIVLPNIVEGCFQLVVLGSLRLNVPTGPKLKARRSFRLFPGNGARCPRPQLLEFALRRKHAGRNGGKYRSPLSNHAESTIRSCDVRARRGPLPSRSARLPATY